MRINHPEAWGLPADYADQLTQALPHFGFRKIGMIGCGTSLWTHSSDMHHTVWQICDNGGELNIMRVNDYESLRSIPFTCFRIPLDVFTMAYRLRCAVAGEQIDWEWRFPADIAAEIVAC
jgi:hypothetical protein